MISDGMKRYLEEMIPARDMEVMRMEQEAKEANVPIMDLIGMEALLQIVRIHRPNLILEIGTAIGYSAIRIVEASPFSKLISVERDSNRYKQAIHNIIKAGLQENIQVLEGDALECASDIQKESPFDLIFIDAAKGQYQRFFQTFEKMLAPGGIIISDNVLFRGWVAKSNEAIDSRRHRKLVQKIRSYNEFLLEQSNYHTSILPVGDGMAVSIKKHNN